MRKIILCLFCLIQSPNLYSAVVTLLPTDSLFVCNTGLSHLHPEVAGLDSVMITYDDLNYDSDSQARQRSQVLSVFAGQPEKSLVTQQKDLWISHITNTKFKFSTEKFGTKYFIELCYRGPVKQVTPEENTVDLTEGLYILDLTLNVSSKLMNGKTYKSSAGLIASVQAICDLRAQGHLKDPRLTAELGVANLETDSWFISNPTSMNSSSLQFQTALNDNFKRVPRFCKFRIELEERATSVARENSLSPQEIDLFLNISQQ